MLNGVTQIWNTHTFYILFVISLTSLTLSSAVRDNNLAAGYFVRCRTTFWQGLTHYTYILLHAVHYPWHIWYTWQFVTSNYSSSGDFTCHTARHFTGFYFKISDNIWNWTFSVFTVIQALMIHSGLWFSELEQHMVSQVITCYLYLCFYAEDGHWRFFNMGNNLLPDYRAS
jgi:hypothetical protein